MILYHATPTKNLDSILKEGLRVEEGNKGSIAFGPAIPGVYFFKDKVDLLEHLSYSRFPGRWSLLKVILPNDWVLEKFEEYPGLTTFYSTKPIPPEYIKVIHSGGSVAFERDFTKDRPEDFELEG